MVKYMIMAAMPVVTDSKSYIKSIKFDNLVYP
jgi:hypothetical protein